MAKKSSKAEFVVKAREVHGDKYNYDEFEYINAITKGKIICPKHGEFWQTPHSHINGQGCKECKKDAISNKLSSNTQDFIEKAKKVHGDKYDYAKTVYERSRFKVIVTCPKHGDFLITPNNHLRGRGCPKCRYDKIAEKLSKTTEDFIQEAKKIHGNNYDYSKVVYKNWNTKICIICKEHGEFWQTPYAHLSLKQGCPKCKQSHLEKEIFNFLKNKNIDFETQKKFDWLKKNKCLPLDFYLSNRNLAVECQGIQHFQSVKYFGGEKKLKLTSFNDKLKKQLCEEHGIEIVYYTHEKVEEPYLGKVFTDINDLIEYINSKE